MQIEMIYPNKNVIASLVYSDPPNSTWLLLCMFGPPKITGGEKFWGLIEDMIKEFFWALDGH